MATETRCTDPAELLRLKARYLVPCVYHFYRNPPHIVAGEGFHLVDHAGRKYIDCYSGVTVMNAGHCNPAIIEPAIEQIRTLQHTTSIYLTEPVLRLAEALATITPPGLTRSFFCASGSEAVESALLLAALHTKRGGIIAMSGGLHGRTKWAINATGLDLWRTDPFPLDSVHHVPFGNIDALESALKRNAGGIAAVIGEPIQGNGGIVVPPPDFWPAVRELCDRHGVLLILDEIQTGFSRTGKWFAAEHWNIAPDIMTTSKAMGNGFPIAAMIARDEIAASYKRPGASTYGGNPVCAAAALAVIEYHRAHALADRAERLGAQFLRALHRISNGCPTLTRPRGMGLMLGVDIVDQSGEPAPQRCDELLEGLKDAGVLAGKTGAARNVLSFMPPLVITEDAIEQVMHVLQDLCRCPEQACH